MHPSRELRGVAGHKGWLGPRKKIGIRIANVQRKASGTAHRACQWNAREEGTIRFQQGMDDDDFHD